MRLSLSSSAAPDATLADLVSASARRGLSGVELREHDFLAGGVRPVTDCVDEALATARAAGSSICGILAEMPRPNDIRGSVTVAARLAAPLVVPWRPTDRDALAGVVPTLSRIGARMLLAHETDPRAVAEARSALESHSGASLGLAWEVRPGLDDPALFAEVLAVAGPHLEYVRFHGGGPEAERQTGRGVGSLMARLTLARFQGPLVLTPSDPRYHQVWRLWLGRAGGWGCGSKQADDSLVVLDRTTHA